MAQTKRLTIAFIMLALISAAVPTHAANAKSPKPAKPAKAARDKVNVVPDAALAIPASSKVKVRWVVPPLSTKAVDDADWYDIDFAVDNAGRPWFAVEYGRIICPTEQYQLATDHFYKGIACLENGAFLVATESDLAFIVPPEAPRVNYDNIPAASLQPLAGLPIPNCKLYAGAGNCVYLVGRNPESGQYEVYALRRTKLASGGSGVREYVKVFSCADTINAVAGDGETTYAAVGSMVIKAVRSTGSVSKIFTHPSEAIYGLAWSPQTGLFYSSYNEIGFIGAKGAIPIMTANTPSICIQNGSLYVMFPRSLGVLAMDNIGDLKRFDKAVKEVPATQSKEVKVTDIRFFEAGETPPDYADRKYAREFDRSKTHYIYCQVDMTNLLKGKRASKQLIEVAVHGENGISFGDSGELTADVDPGSADAWAWVRFGRDTPGSFHPGKYTVKTYLNGSKIDERHFIVNGDATVLEAAANGDSIRMWKLLENGEDANSVNSDGDSALIVAARQGSLENVRLLLNHEANVNAKDSEGNTPLLVVSDWCENNSAMVRLLLEHGADPNAADKDGKTALHKAAEDGNIEIIRTLLESKANPNVRDKIGTTPLMAMHMDSPTHPRHAKPEYLELLLKNGADPNICDNYDYSALMDAIRGTDIKLVKTLLDSGADFNKNVKYSDGTIHSLLWWMILTREIEMERVDREELGKIVELLCERGAMLRSDEVEYAFAHDWQRFFTRKQIVSMLEINNQAVFTYEPKDPWLRKYVLNRILRLGLYDISIARDMSAYRDALSVCMVARNRAEAWGLASKYPEIYFNCGMLAAKTGDEKNADSWLQKYLDLAPDGDKVEAAWTWLGRL